MLMDLPDTEDSTDVVIKLFMIDAAFLLTSCILMSYFLAFLVFSRFVEDEDPMRLERIRSFCKCILFSKVSIGRQLALKQNVCQMLYLCLSRSSMLKQVN